MPHQFEAFKLSQQGNLNSKKTVEVDVISGRYRHACVFFDVTGYFLELGVDRGEVGSQINSFGGRVIPFYIAGLPRHAPQILRTS